MPTGFRENCCFYCFMILAPTIFIGILVIWPFLADSSKPEEPKFTITNAMLTRFEFSASNPNNILSYSLSLNLTITNPNDKGGVYFERFQVITEYRGNTFGVSTLAGMPFQLGPHNTTFLKAILEGNQAVYFGEETDIKTYRLEKEARVFSVDVKLALRLRNVTYSNTKKFLEPSKIECYGLKIPLRSANTTTHGTTNSSNTTMVFEAKSCSGVYIFNPPHVSF